MTTDTQRTVWHLTSAWLSGTERQREIVGHIANRLAQNGRWFVMYHLTQALYGWHL